MKTFKIFLLVLVILGAVLFLTKSFWLPIFVSQNIVPVITQPNLTLVDGRQCYAYSHEATADAPYTTNEFLDITINGTQVTGTKKGTQNGPDMTNGYTGTIVGTLANNTITDVFSYVIEGSSNKEQEIYRANQTGVEKLRYPLVEKGGILVPDTTQEPPQVLLYPRVGCTASDGNASLILYKNASMGFSISYPTGFTVDASYAYQALGPGKDIKGVKFTIPSSLSTGTNLSTDTYISVESIKGAINSCSAEIYLNSPKSNGFIDENGHRYSVATATDAAAGNRYEETVYATPTATGCLAVRYFIHYGVFENYPAGTINQFDKQALLNKFDAIRHTLVLN